MAVSVLPVDIERYIDPGSVSVRMRVTPTSINVAPNSPIPRAQVKTNAEIRALRQRGRVIVRKVVNGEAPKVFATNSMRVLMPSKAVRTMRMVKGRLTISWANTMPTG